MPISLLSIASGFLLVHVSYRKLKLKKKELKQNLPSSLTTEGIVFHNIIQQRRNKKNLEEPKSQRNEF